MLKMPREGGRMLVKAGEENAGLMDMVMDMEVFKIESHNHPSLLNLSRCATGVGGIHRDIFTMGQDQSPH
jgi:phosphoribosylformylglycinamidine synthase